MTDGAYKCARCHVVPVRHRLKFCDDCYSESRKAMRMAVAQFKEEHNECCRCQKPAMQFKRYCEEHLAYVVRASRIQYRRENPEVKRVFRCSRCHEPGHFAKSCKQPKPAWKL